MRLTKQNKGLGEPATIAAIGSVATGIFQGIFGAKQRRNEIKAQLEMARLTFRDNENERQFQREVLKANQEFQRELNAQNINLHNIRALNNLLDLDSQVIQTQKSELNNIMVNIAPMLKYVCHRFLATKTEELEDKVVEISNQYRVYLKNTLDVYVNFSNDEHELLKELENTIQKKNNLKPIFPTELFEQDKDYTLVDPDFYNQNVQNFLKTLNFDPFTGGNSEDYARYRRYLLGKYITGHYRYISGRAYLNIKKRPGFANKYERSGQKYGAEDMTAYEYYKRHRYVPNEEQKLSFYEKVREEQHAKKIQELNENITRIKKILGEKKSYSALAEPINEIKNFYVQNQEAVADYSFRDKFIRGAYFLYLLLSDIGEDPWNTLAVLYYYNQVRGVANYYPNASVIQKVYTGKAQTLYSEFFAFISKNRVRYYDYSDNVKKEWINEQELPFFIKGMVLEGNLAKSKTFFDQYYLMERQSKEYQFIKKTLEFTTVCFNKEQEFLAGLFFNFILQDIKFSKQEVIPELVKVFEQFNQRFTEYMNLDKHNRVYRKLSKANHLKADFVSIYKSIGLTPLAILDETDKGFDFTPEERFEGYLSKQHENYLFSVSELNTLASKLVGYEDYPDVRAVTISNLSLKLPAIRGYVGKDLFSDESYFEFLRIFETKLKAKTIAMITAQLETIKNQPRDAVSQEDQKTIQPLVDAYQSKTLRSSHILNPDYVLDDKDKVLIKIRNHPPITSKDYLNLMALLIKEYPQMFAKEAINRISTVTLRNRVYKPALLDKTKEQQAIAISEDLIQNDRLSKVVFDYVVSSKDQLIVIGDYQMDLELLDRVKTLYKKDWEQKNKGLLYMEDQRKKYESGKKSIQNNSTQDNINQLVKDDTEIQTGQRRDSGETPRTTEKTSLNPILQNALIGLITYSLFNE